MSDNEEKEKNIPGHSPAMVVGGMRVSKGHHAPNPQKESKEIREEKKTVEEFIANPKNNALVKKDNKLGLIVNGAHVDIKEAFPTKAVKSYHEKPTETVNALAHQPPDTHIFQPREYSLYNK